MEGQTLGQGDVPHFIWPSLFNVPHSQYILVSERIQILSINYMECSFGITRRSTALTRRLIERTLTLAWMMGLICWRTLGKDSKIQLDSGVNYNARGQLKNRAMRWREPTSSVMVVDCLGRRIFLYRYSWTMGSSTTSSLRSIGMCVSSEEITSRSSAQASMMPAPCKNTAGEFYDPFLL